MAKIEKTITVHIEPRFKLSLWDAIKLRIAGNNYKPLVEKMLVEMENLFNKQKD